MEPRYQIRNNDLKDRCQVYKLAPLSYESKKT